ncbi:MAG TPA: Mut7-C RNAse domain-containing protein [Pseudonocardiaceae bacterium]|nr:Mut7-C RNAse domain-containing protein [Pseudonocardiaceae bacterium]
MGSGSERAVPLVRLAVAPQLRLLLVAKWRAPRAGREDRLLLTQDRGLLRRRTLRRAAYVAGSNADGQLADVLDRFRLPLAPYTRCPACGDTVQPVPKAEVEAQLEPGTRRTRHNFTRCRSCARIYWRGAHAARLDALIRRYT